MVVVIFIVFLLSVFSFIKIGRFTTELIFRITGNQTSADQAIPLHVLYTLGLLIYLALLLLIKCVHLPWFLSPVLLICPLLIRPFDYRALFFRMLPKPSFNFALYFTVILVLGASLFDVTKGIQSAWANNYGDLAFHIGMITSFVWGDNFPPQYHIFPGQLLSYPFFINLWSASLWWIAPTFQSLQFVFVLQWVAIWIVVYYAFDGNRMRVLPWAVLFGGGAFHYFTYVFENAANPGMQLHSGQLIDKGYPWTSFLTTIWITQRSSLLGLCFVPIVSKLFLEALQFSAGGKERSSYLILSGAILSLSLLAHTHFFLATGLFCGILLSWDMLKSIFDKAGKPLSVVNDFLTFILAVTPSVLFLPFIFGKRSIIDRMYGWKPWANDGTTTGLISGASEMWLHNAPLFIASIILLLLISSKRSPLAAIILLFIAGNLVKLSIWEWDQLKFFVPLYLITLAVWSSLKSKTAFHLHFAAVLLTIPSLFETLESMATFRKNVIYPKEIVSAAEEIRAATEPDAILLAAPNHNSPVTLTGRKLFSGYDGTLHSHSIDYYPRHSIVQIFDRAVNCKSLTDLRESDQKYCPKYLIWTQHEVNFWKSRTPKSTAKLEKVNEFVYRLKN